MQDDHWYISTFHSWDYVIIDKPMVVLRLFSGNVIVNDYVVLAVKCRDKPMVIRRLYSGNVIVNDYVVPARPLIYLYILQPGLRNH
jgi:hypothetical protein